MADLRLTRRARRDLSELPPPIREAVLATLGDVQTDPEAAGKQLVGRLRGRWSARVGVYRVIYRIDRRQVIVITILHRAAAYGSRKPILVRGSRSARS